MRAWVPHASISALGSTCALSAILASQLSRPENAAQEVMFVKVKGFLLDLRWTTAKEAATLDRWMQSQVGQGLGHDSFSLFGTALHGVPETNT